MFGAIPPWLTGMMGQQDMGQMTPGAGMPPSMAPGGQTMGPMQPPAPMMGPPRGGPPQPMPPPQQEGQGKGPLNPAQMMMLQQALAGQTQQPRWNQISPESMEGVIPGMSGADTKSYMQGIAPDKPPIPPWLLGLNLIGGGQGGF